MADLLSGVLYEHGLKFRNWTGYPRTGSAALVVPGRYWAGHEAEISDAISFYDWCLMFITSDEEATFQAGLIDHPNVRFWIQSPRKDFQYPEARFFGVGYTPHMRNLPTDPPDKNLDVFLSAQRTHKRREQAFDALKDTHLHVNQHVEEQGGFTEGMSPDLYAEYMVGAKVAPAPSGAVSPDSFRLFEALEAHCIPIADAVSPVDGTTDYWTRLFPDAPFPILTDYQDLAGYVQDALKGWPANSNRIAAWWMRTKRQYAQWLKDDLRHLGAVE